jgi:hypothetical protein
MSLATSSSTKIEDGSGTWRQETVTLQRSESSLSGTTPRSCRRTTSTGVCPRRARSHHPLGRQHRCQTWALHRRWSCRRLSSRRHLKMMRIGLMRFPMNPLFAIGRWTASSVTTCLCQGRHNGFFHRPNVVDHGGYRRNSNSLLVGVS